MFIKKRNMGNWILVNKVRSSAAYAISQLPEFFGEILEYLSCIEYAQSLVGFLSRVELLLILVAVPDNG